MELPSEENIVTFLNLGLFWYSHGQWQRMLVYEGNATCVMRLLGLSRMTGVHGDGLAAEMSRRRLWACFLVNQFVAQSAASKMDLDDFATLPLPCDEDDFAIGSIPKTHVSISDEERTTSYYAELIRISGLW